jgi:hypothetical protein
VLAPMSLRIKYQNATEFSLYRFIIPELCNYQGRGIYLDADMVCLADIGTLFDADMDDFDFLAKPGALERRNGTTWALSTMLINCSRCRFSLEQTYDEIEAGVYTYRDFAQMHPNFLRHHEYAIGEMDRQWNVFDCYDRDTKLIHYTTLQTQPWKYYDHPYGDLWFRYFHEAREAGYITEDDIAQTIIRGYVRPDIVRGNSSPPLAVEIRRRLKVMKRRYFRVKPLAGTRHGSC